jgi:hypothetical protein
MRARFLLLGLFPALFWAQKEPDYLQCYLKSLTTVCNRTAKRLFPKSAVKEELPYMAGSVIFKKDYPKELLKNIKTKSASAALKM